MMKEAIQPVVLCGGAGTRLWPLSRKSFPKQFVPLIGEKSLLQLTLERLALIAPDVWVVTADDHRFMVTHDMQQANVGGRVILEPTARNTAPAMALAVLQQQNPQALLLFCPADHHIPDAQAFAQTVARGVAAAKAGAIVTFGVTPSFPSTAYGYIAQGPKRADGSHQVQRFIEKPDAANAQRLLLEGGVSWNAGIFLCTAQTLQNALQQHVPDIWQACQQAMTETATDVGPSGHAFIRPHAQAFAQSPSQSIDYAVMEHATDVAVVQFEGQWSDVGSWNAVAELTPVNAQGNRLEGHAIALHSQHNFVHAPHRPVALLGVENLLVVDTPDAVLVLHRDAAEKVREVVAALEQSDMPHADTHRKVARPWGWYDTVDEAQGFKVKRIQVNPGASLSLQKHHHRAEHWIVVKGVAEVTCDDQVMRLQANQSTYIPLGAVHRLANPGDAPLEIIEVQSGDYLGEDDIVRLEDHYGRSS